MKFSRTWAMPSADTFSIKPIGDFVKRYLLNVKYHSVDPFARSSCLAEYTNDINPNTIAKYHLDAVDFLKHMKGSGVWADLVILDMPYSPRQISECYKEIGMKVTQQHTQSGNFYKSVRDAADPLVPQGGVVLSFGWNTVGMGIKRGYEIEEIMLCCHGGAHNDTICMAERKL
jgi:hypothetical protein